MPLSKNIKNFLHIGQVLDAALKAGGGRFTLSSPKAAVRWRSEAYYYRKLFEEEQRARLGFEKGVAVRTPYDDMFLTIEGTTVVIGRREFNGELRGPDGERIPLEEPRPLLEDTPVEEEDDLVRQAEELRKQLIGEGNGEQEPDTSETASDVELELPDSLKRD